MRLINQAPVYTNYAFRQVNGLNNTSASGTQAVSFSTYSPVAGNLLIAFGGFVSGVLVSSVSDTLGNVWNNATAGVSWAYGLYPQLFWAVNKSSGADTATFTFSGTAGGSPTYFGVLEYTVTGGPPSVDAQGYIGSGSCPFTVSTTNCTGNADLVIGLNEWGGTCQTPSGYNARYIPGGSGSAYFMCFDKIATASGAQSATITASSGVGSMDAFLIAFQSVTVPNSIICGAA